LAIFMLTIGADTFIGGPGKNNVDSIATTLKAGPRLTSGSGTDRQQSIDELPAGLQRIKLNSTSLNSGKASWPTTLPTK
jgi:hypothetical protein